MTPTPARARGFTLVEMVVSMVAAGIVILAALALLGSQQRLFRSSSGDRRLQEDGRIALDEISTNLRMAGYGVDPALAFDFGGLTTFPMDRAPTGAVVSAATYACTSAIDCRDRIDDSDEIVLLYRNPRFARSVAVAPTGDNTLIIAGPLNAPLYKGQILQVMCFGGDQRWAYVTVGQNVAVNTAAAQITITLANGVADQFPYQNAYLTNACFGTVAPRGAAAATFANAAKVYKVDRFRYFIQSYDASGAVVANGTPGARPYLMLDQGLKDSAHGDQALLTAIAPDVEDLQFSYVFPNSPSAAQRLVGATANTRISPGSTGIDRAPAGAPKFADPSDAPSRATQHPSNIRAVNVAIVVRSSEPDLEMPITSGSLNDLLPPAGNRPGIAAPAYYTRQVFRTSAAVRNTDARAPYFPVYTTTAGDDMQVGGG